MIALRRAATSRQRQPLPQLRAAGAGAVPRSQRLRADAVAGAVAGEAAAERQVVQQRARRSRAGTRGQWRTVVAYGRLTNAKRVALKEAGKSKASRSPARRGQSGEASSSAAGSSAAQGEQQGEQRGRKRASRAGRYSAEPKGPVPWPAARLVGKHRLGWNDTGSATYCDYPLCNIVNASWVPQAMPPPPPKQPAASKRKKSTVGPPTLAALAAADDSDVCPPAGSQSDAASESSRASNRLQTRTKIFCKDCLDANQVRCMNFHADCYNKWHGFE